MTRADARVISKYLTRLPVSCRQVRGNCCIFVAGNMATRWFASTWESAVDKLANDLQVPRHSSADVLAASTDDESGSPSPKGVAGDNDSTIR